MEKPQKKSKIQEVEKLEAVETLKEEEEYLRVNEAADYLNVTLDAINLWLSHGHLDSQLINGIKMIPLTSILGCRIRVRLAKILPNKEYFLPREVANFLSLKATTIYDWINKGKIEAVEVGPFKTIRISRDVVEKLVQPKID